MSLFRRVTRYRISPSQDPRENRLTEITAAVLESVDGFALDVVETVLSDSEAGLAQRDDGAAALERAAVALHHLRELDRPRLRVGTQVTTASTKFVDLELRFAPRPFEQGGSVLLWVEVKHGADVHGTQLDDYVRDIALTDADERLVLVLAPRQREGELTGVPPSVPVVRWQTVGDVARRWATRPGVTDVERFLLEEYVDYLYEEGLMDDALLTAEHAFVLRAQPAAEAIATVLVERVDDHVARHWGARSKAAGGTRPAYGLAYWAHYPLAREGAATAAHSWRSTTFEWGLTTDVSREEPRDAWVFVAGATFWSARENPATQSENAGWLASQRAAGFEYLNDWYWKLARFKYPEELLAATTLDEQVEELGSWVVRSFELLADAPPPH